MLLGPFWGRAFGTFNFIALVLMELGYMVLATALYT